jgi:hypothetical protein
VIAEVLSRSFLAEQLPAVKDGLRDLATEPSKTKLLLAEEDGPPLPADPRFGLQARSSWFRLENAHWRLFGLDTAWDEVGLMDPRDFSCYEGPFTGPTRPHAVPR